MSYIGTYTQKTQIILTQQRIIHNNINNEVNPHRILTYVIKFSSFLWKPLNNKKFTNNNKHIQFNKIINASTFINQDHVSLTACYCPHSLPPNYFI